MIEQNFAEIGNEPSITDVIVRMKRWMWSLPFIALIASGLIYRFAPVFDPDERAPSWFIVIGFLGPLLLSPLAAKKSIALSYGMLIAPFVWILCITTIDNNRLGWKDTKEQTAALLVNQVLRTGLVAFKLDLGRYPSTAEGLTALAHCPPGLEAKWHGPYLDKIPLDPWRHPLEYTFTEGMEKPLIRSLGPDGKRSADDISNDGAR